VLRAYAAYDQEVNYCQGMNFLAALLLLWLPSEEDAFGAFVLVMKDRGLRELYKTDMAMLQAGLQHCPHFTFSALRPQACFEHDLASYPL
jgi:hypothetical protein